MRFAGCALLAVLVHVLGAQSGRAPVEGVVVGRIDHAGIPETHVTLFTPDRAQYQASTDVSGVFRITDVQEGEYSVVIEKRGFVLFPKERVHVGRTTSDDAGVRVRYETQFGTNPSATLTGRVLDSQDKPLAFAQVDLIHGPSESLRTTTNEDGRFVFAPIDPGSYQLRAVPPHGRVPSEQPQRVEQVATYFPSRLTSTEPNESSFTALRMWMPCASELLPWSESKDLLRTKTTRRRHESP
jgi:hypothetical protein